MLLITTILLGGAQFFFGGRRLLQSARLRRLAVICLAERAEYLRQLNYTQLVDSLNESATEVKYGQYSLWRTTLLQNIDDALDGTGSADTDANPIDYKKVKIVVAWSARPADCVSATIIAAEDYQP